MTDAELLALAASPVIEIGAHTVTHPILKGLAPGVQAQEIRQSKASLESCLGREVTSFAYPFGTAADVTVGLVREAGFQRACATAAGLVEPDTDRCRLPRMTVENWTATEFASRLTGWTRD